MRNSFAVINLQDSSSSGCAYCKAGRFTALLSHASRLEVTLFLYCRWCQCCCSTPASASGQHPLTLLQQLPASCRRQMCMHTCCQWSCLPSLLSQHPSLVRSALPCSLPGQVTTACGVAYLLRDWQVRTHETGFHRATHVLGSAVCPCIHNAVLICCGDSSDCL